MNRRWNFSEVHNHGSQSAFINRLFENFVRFENFHKENSTIFNEIYINNKSKESVACNISNRFRGIVGKTLF